MPQLIFLLTKCRVNKMGGEGTEIMVFVYQLPLLPTTSNFFIECRAQEANEMIVVTDIEETVIADALDHQITAAIAAQKETLTHTLQVAATVIENVRTDTHRRGTVRGMVRGTAAATVAVTAVATAIGIVTEVLTAETPGVTTTRDPADESETLTMTAEEVGETGVMMGLQNSKSSSRAAVHHLQRKENPPLI